jgi:hypothetical protein
LPVLFALAILDPQTARPAGAQEPTATTSVTATPTVTPTPEPQPQPELLTQNPFFEDGLDYWTYNQYVTLCDESDPDAPCVRLRMFGEIRQTFESPGYGTLYVAAFARQSACPANTVYVQLCLESAQYGQMCRAWPLPYGDGQEFVAQYDHMPGGEYTMYVRY